MAHFERAASALPLTSDVGLVVRLGKVDQPGKRSPVTSFQPSH